MKSRLNIQESGVDKHGGGCIGSGLLYQLLEGVLCKITIHREIIAHYLWGGAGLYVYKCIQYYSKVHCINHIQ